MKNSKIVNKYWKLGEEDEIELIKKWIDSTNYNKVSFKLLYRATEHGKLAAFFHSRCDNKVTLKIDHINL